MDVTFDKDGARFTVRVAGLFLHEGYVLMNNSDADELWNLTGGRVHLAEQGADGLRCEMLEELGEEVTVGPLQWVIESFFTYDGCRNHEIGLYYQVRLTNPALYDTAQSFRGVEGDSLGLTYRWFPIQRIDEVQGLVPRCLYQALKRLPCGLTYIVNDGHPALP